MTDTYKLINPQQLGAIRQTSASESGWIWNPDSNLGVEFYLYPTVSTALVHSVKPKLTE